MMEKRDFSVIIPHRNSVHLLPRLFASIPDSDRIEIILVDNSPTPVSKDDIGIARNYELLYSVPERGAGGARNEGIEHACGKWLIFADADDYFADNAFDVFYSVFDSDAEIVYTQAKGEYLDTGVSSDRGKQYENLVKDYHKGKIDEYTLRLHFSTPWAKMVSNELVRRHHLRYDEVIASNDIYFSILTGYYAKTILAIEKITYVVTVSRGTLTRRRDYNVCITRLEVGLRCNKFLRTHGLSCYQKSIMARFRELCKNGIGPAFEGIKLIIRYKQNPFVGYKRWLTSYIFIINREKKEKAYITH